MYVEEDNLPSSFNSKNLLEYAEKNNLSLKDYTTSLILQIDYNINFDEASEHYLIPLSREYFEANYIDEESNAIELIKLVYKSKISNNHTLMQIFSDSLKNAFDTNVNDEVIRENFYFQLLLNGYFLNIRFYFLEDTKISKDLPIQLKKLAKEQINKFMDSYKLALSTLEEEITQEKLSDFTRKFEDLIHIEVLDYNNIRNNFNDFKSKMYKKDIKNDNYNFQLDENNYFFSIDKIKPNLELKYCTARVNAETIVDLFEKFGYELFEGNVRYFLSYKNKVYREIKKTLSSKDLHKYFWYLNNGIVIIASRLNYDESKMQLHVKSPRVINGCQTTISISKNKKLLVNKETSIMIKFIELNPSELGKVDEKLYSKLKEEIIIGSNTQQPIYNYDIVTLDPIHERLKQEFSNLKQPYFYEYKRGIWETEINKQIYLKKDFENTKRIKKSGCNIISMIEAAQAYFSILGFPTESKAKKSLLFERGVNGFYDQIFNDALSARKLLFANNIFKLVNQRKKDYNKRFSIIKTKVDLLIQNKPNNINRYDYLRQKLPAEEYELVVRQFVSHASYHIVGLVGLVFSKKYDKDSSKYLDNDRIISGFIYHDPESYKKLNNLLDALETRLESFFHLKISNDVAFTYTRFFKVPTSFKQLDDLINTDIRLFSAMQNDPYTQLI